MPDNENENLLTTQDLEDSVSIDNLTQSPDMDGDDVVVLVHENNGVKSTYKAILRSIANFINKLLHYSTDLHTQNDTIIGAINELADGGGGSADIISESSGTIATFNDGGDNIPVKSLVTEITATQAGTGTPAPDNIRAITGFDEVDVVVSSKNLFKAIDGAVTGSGITFTMNADRTISASGSISSGNNNKNVGHVVLPAGTYTLSGIPETLIDTTVRKAAMALARDGYSGSVNLIGTLYSNVSTSLTFTLTETTDCYLKIYVYGGAGTLPANTVFKPMIESGEYATEYEIQISDTHTITLPDTIYGGTADVANGTGTKSFNAVDLGDLTYTYDSTNTRMVAVISDLKSTGTRRTPFVCSCFQTIDDGRELINVPNNSVYSGNVDNTNVYIQTTETDPVTFKTAVTGQTLVYPIEDTDIVFAPVKILTLAGLNNIYSNTDDVEIEYFNSNADQTAELIDAKQEYANYSYDEKVVGTWVDGSPLYEKTLYFNNVKLDKADNTSGLVHGVENIGSVRFVTEVYFDFSGGTNGWSPANNGLWNNGVYNFYWVCGETSLYILSASGVYFDPNPNRSYLVKIRYTKA